MGDVVCHGRGCGVDSRSHRMAADRAVTGETRRKKTHAMGPQFPMKATVPSSQPNTCGCSTAIAMGPYVFQIQPCSKATKLVTKRMYHLPAHFL